MMLIGLVPSQIQDLHPSTVLMYGKLGYLETWLSGEVKDRQLLLDVVQKQSSESWPAEYVKECG